MTRSGDPADSILHTRDPETSYDNPAPKAVLQGEKTAALGTKESLSGEVGVRESLGEVELDLDSGDGGHAGHDRGAQASLGTSGVNESQDASSSEGASSEAESSGPEDAQESEEKGETGESGNDDEDGDSGDSSAPEDLTQDSVLKGEGFEQDPEGLADLEGRDAASTEGELKEEQARRQEQQLNRVQQFVQDNTALRDLLTIGVLNANLSSRRPGVFPVRQEEVSRLREVFVASQECERYFASAASRHLLVVRGPDRSGKSATAKSVGGWLAGYGRGAKVAEGASEEVRQLFIYTPPQEEQRFSLSHVLKEDQLREDAVVILEDVVAGQLNQSEIKAIESLEHRLRSRRIHLILTTETGLGRRFDSVPQVDSRLDSPRLRKLLERVLRAEWRGRSEPRLDWVEGFWNRLGAERFDNPVVVQQFAQSVLQEAEQGEALTVDEALHLARNLSRSSRQQLTQTYASLPLNAQVLAILAVFFPDLSSYELVDLYRQTVSWLRQDGFTELVDARQANLAEMKILAGLVELEDRLRFESASHVASLSEALDANRLLLEAVMRTLLANYGSVRSSASWQFRKGLGFMVGHFSMLDAQNFLEITETFGASRQRNAGTILGYAFTMAMGQDLERATPQAVAWLWYWLSEENSHLRWATGHAAWQAFHFLMIDGYRMAGSAEVERAKSSLFLLLREMCATRWSLIKKLAVLQQIQQNGVKHWFAAMQRANLELSKERRIGVCFAISKILSVYPSEIMDHLAQWILEGTEVRNICLEALWRAVGEGAPLGREVEASLLTAALRSASPENQRLTGIFGKLAGRAGESSELASMGEGLLDISGQAKSLERRRLRWALATTWQRSPQALDLAKRAIRRSWYLDGRLGVSRSEAVSLMVFNRRGLTRRWKVVGQYTELVLRSMTTLRRAHLGTIESWPARGDFSDVETEPTSPPGLLSPLIRASASWEPRIIVVVTEELPLDLGDFLPADHAAQLLVLHCGAQSADPSEAETGWWRERVVPLGKSAVEATFATIDRELTKLLWSALSSEASESSVLGEGWPPEGLEPRLEGVRALVEQRLQRAVEAPGYSAILDLMSAFRRFLRNDFYAAVRLLAEWVAHGERTDEVSGMDPGAKHDSGEVQTSRDQLVMALVGYTLRHGTKQTEPFDMELLASELFSLLHSAFRHQRCDAPFVVEILEGWLVQEEWQVFLGEPYEAETSPIQLLAQVQPVALKSELFRILKRLETAAAGHLKSQVADVVSEPYQERLPSLAGGSRQHALILVAGGADALVWNLAERLAHALKEQSFSRPLEPTLFQLGWAKPLWRPGKPWTVEPLTSRPVPLLGPIWSPLEETSEDVAFTLILGATTPVDSGDWAHSALAERLFLLEPLFDASSSPAPWTEAEDRDEVMREMARTVAAELASEMTAYD